ncbi:membrane protein [Lactococcus hodotermopsidis]|uniref:Membrane protein n=1 Tax=Pseudolactococcus hodotermopsidis TaxID=2709157 RepID=A0A6A0BBB7_9LACT|nr:YoaK family protein [Lactococcus hodotermopsidis]GFH42642.1 membrane protein [Lactococcus hodotermopsidis]
MTSVTETFEVPETNDNIRIFERARVAVQLTFISGFLDAYTFSTQGERFAGIQTGNAIYLMKSLAQGNFAATTSYLFPICAFICGAIFTYFARKFAIAHRHLRWHATAGAIIFIGVLLTALTSSFAPPQWIIMSLAFISAVQLESFKKMRGAPYTNIMMTGNIKNMAVFIAQGLVEKNGAVLKRGVNTLFVVLSFCLGVFIATILANWTGEKALYAVLPVILIFNVMLYLENRFKI